MEQVKALPRTLINKIRNYPSKFGFVIDGFPERIEEFSDNQLSEMFYGVYKTDKRLLTDGDYFISLTDVVQSICELVMVTHHQEPVNKEMDTINESTIKNIRTFYVKDYYLMTHSDIFGTKKHKITRYLYKVGAINQGRHKYARLYSCRNSYKVLQVFSEGMFPKDLYYPIKSYINGLFFEDHYYISDFRVDKVSN